MGGETCQPAPSRLTPVVVLTGPRQAGKSTLARKLLQPDRDHFFDLEDPRDLARLGEPTLSLSALGGTVVIDEAQLRPDLFPILRVLVDEGRRPGRFLVLGSATPDLIGLSAESLAGRVTFVELSGLMVHDVGTGELTNLWLRGALPPAFVADDIQSARWRDDYITTFLERDFGEPGLSVAADDDASVLDDACALSRADVERRRTEQGARSERADGARASRCADRRIDGASAAAVVREDGETLGEVTEGVPA